jgi:hypothetical protein
LRKPIANDFSKATSLCNTREPANTDLRSIEEGQAAHNSDRNGYSAAAAATNEAANAYHAAVAPSTTAMSEALREMMVAVNKHLRTGDQGVLKFWKKP